MSIFHPSEIPTDTLDVVDTLDLCGYSLMAVAICNAISLTDFIMFSVSEVLVFKPGARRPYTDCLYACVRVCVCVCAQCIL